MTETEGKTSQPFDPLESLRTLRDAYLDAMAKTMVEAVNTDAYAQATGAMLEGYLSASAPFREALDKSMVQALQQLSLPSRQEVAALAERFTHVEMRIDDMDARLDAIGQFLRGQKPTEPAPEPRARATPAEKEAGHAGNPAPVSAKRRAAHRPFRRQRGPGAARR